jgi:LCP family protein required for cell wall assembly
MTPAPNLSPIEQTEAVDLRGIYSENTLNPGQPKKHTRLWFWLKLLLVVFSTGLVATTFFTSKTLSGTGAGTGFSWLNNFSIVKQISEIAQSTTQKLRGEDRGRINILLTGIGGENHDGGQLTDTIMLLSLDTTDKKVAMISVPRDLAVPIEGYGSRKINSINAFAEKDTPGSGGQAVADSFNKYFNQPIDYYARVDFSGFSQFIDDLGGVDVNVEHQLDDYAYPIIGQEDNPNYYARYEHLRVMTGLQHMDGALALKFARSRHGINGEGSDFARAKRQQLVIEAVKAKLNVSSILLNPTLVTKTIANYQKHVSTNLESWEILRFWSLLKDVQKDQIINKVLDDSPDNLLYSSRGLDNAYILLPKAGNFSEVQEMMANIFNTTSATDKNKISVEAPTIIVENGTYKAGLASKIGDELVADGFKLIDTTNAKQRNYTSSTIYQLSTTTKPTSLDLLKTKTGASVSTQIPAWLQKELDLSASYIADYIKPDFVLIVGTDATSKKSTTTNENTQ